MNYKSIAIIFVISLFSLLSFDSGDCARFRFRWKQRQSSRDDYYRPYQTYFNPFTSQNRVTNRFLLSPRQNPLINTLLGGPLVRIY